MSNLLDRRFLHRLCTGSSSSVCSSFVMGETATRAAKTEIPHVVPRCVQASLWGLLCTCVEHDNISNNRWQCYGRTNAG